MDELKNKDQQIELSVREDFEVAPENSQEQQLPAGNQVSALQPPRNVVDKSVSKNKNVSRLNSVLSNPRYVRMICFLMVLFGVRQLHCYMDQRDQHLLMASAWLIFLVIQLLSSSRERPCVQPGMFLVYAAATFASCIVLWLLLHSLIPLSWNAKEIALDSFMLFGSGGFLQLVLLEKRRRPKEDSNSLEYRS